MKTIEGLRWTTNLPTPGKPQPNNTIYIMSEESQEVSSEKKPLISQLLKEHLSMALKWINAKRFETIGVITENFVLKITYGPVAYTKLITNGKRIEGLSSFRSQDGVVILVPPEKYVAAWSLVPDVIKGQLTEAFIGKPDIEIRTEYTVFYKGRRVGRMLDQGTDTRGFSYPSDFNNGPSFYTHSEAQGAAIKLRNYINSLSSKKGNNNFERQ